MRSWTGRKTRKPGGGAWRRACTLASAIALALLVGVPSATAETYDPAADMSSMYNTTAYIGATAWWKAGYTGKGIDVALIDTGVAAVPGLDGPGKIIYGPDLSLESQAPNLRNLDTNGHGTFMAGLIAGHDLNLSVPYGQAPASAYRGIAPEARIVSLKVGVADGGVDVSQVIAAIDWVVQHRTDNGMNIRVLNLSYGTNSLQPYEADPLAFAVEQAWQAGIVVVAAAGNSGYQIRASAPGLADPAYDPYVIAVGGSDPMGTATLADDTIGTYSASATICPVSCRAPDFVAPGSHLQGLRVVNSYIDANHPEGVIDARFFRGSGTSQSAAIVSGAAALILEKYPKYSPDQVKRLLAAGAVKLSGTSSKSQGAGEIDLAATLGLKASGGSKQTYTQSTGTGTLELARGSDHISMDGVVLSGEQDIMGSPFDSAAMAILEAQAKSWSGGDWNGKSWSGASWSGNSWSGKSWSGASWSGKSWSSCEYSGNSWVANSWSAKSWSGVSWSGASWSGDSWAIGSWS